MTTLMGRSKARFVAFAVLPATAVALGAVAGVLQWQIVSYRETASAVGDSVQAARSTAARILSYQADTVEQDLTAARDHLTGPFLDSYTELVNSVIPAARERQISAVAEVVAAASGLGHTRACRRVVVHQPDHHRGPRGSDTHPVNGAGDTGQRRRSMAGLRLRSGVRAML